MSPASAGTTKSALAAQSARQTHRHPYSYPYSISKFIPLSPLRLRAETRLPSDARARLDTAPCPVRASYTATATCTPAHLPRPIQKDRPAAPEASCRHCCRRNSLSFTRSHSHSAQSTPETKAIPWCPIRNKQPYPGRGLMSRFRLVQQPALQQTSPLRTTRRPANVICFCYASNL
jgi:hypothetical protein